MRLLFLFLVLVNGAIYLWYTFNSEPVQAMSAAAEPDAPRLVLLTEQNDLPQVQAGTEQGDAALSDSADKKSRSSSKQCYTIGPFMNKDSVSNAARHLMSTGRPFEKRASDKKELIGYWVMIPPLKNESEARNKVQELKLMGDKHHFIVREPAAEKYSISLGVFHSRENAERRHSRMKNLGFNVRLEGRYRQDPVYWLDYTEHDDSAELDLEVFDGAQRLPGVCAAVASNRAVP